MPDPGSFSAVPRRRRWLLFIPFALVVVLAAGWSVVWFYAAARAEPELAAWREAERRAGRTQDCASQSRAAERFLILIPPFTPAACWCALTMVESMACSLSAGGPRLAKVSNAASHTPSLLQRVKRTKTE